MLASENHNSYNNFPCHFLHRPLWYCILFWRFKCGIWIWHI